MATQPNALRLAAFLDDASCGGSNWNANVRDAAAELRRLLSVNAELLAALRRLYLSAPTSTNCNDFHHSASERHYGGAECKPLAEYLAALADARELMAPSTQEGK